MHDTDRSIEAFLDAVASAAVAPAGGTVVAVVGAAGAALCEMACVHTLRADEIPRSEHPLGPVRSELERRREGLLTLADADARVVDAAFGSAGDDGVTDGKPADGRERRILKRTIGIPLTIAESCGTVIELGASVIDGATHGVVVDAWAGLSIARAALEAAAFTVRSNLAEAVDPRFDDRIRTRLAETEHAAATVFARITDDDTFDPSGTRSDPINR